MRSTIQYREQLAKAGQYGSEANASRHITENNAVVWNTYDGKFHIDSLLPIGILSASLFILYYLRKS